MNHFRHTLVGSTLMVVFGCGGTSDNGAAKASSFGGATTAGAPSLGGTSAQSGSASGGAGESGHESGGTVASGGTVNATGGAISGGGAVNGGSSGGGTINATGGAISGGSGGGGTINATGGHSIGGGAGATGTLGAAGSETSGRCDAPSCCVPLLLTAAHANVYQLGQSIAIVPIFERLDSAIGMNRWEVTADVALPWDQNITCSASVSGLSTNRFVALTCPLLQVSSPLTCGSLLTLRFSPRSTLYTGATGDTATCTGGAGPDFVLVVPVECPTCPSPSGSFQMVTCDYPSSSTCSYTAAMPNGTTAQLPCRCGVSSTTGAQTWACAVP